MFYCIVKKLGFVNILLQKQNLRSYYKVQQPDNGENIYILLDFFLFTNVNNISTKITKIHERLIAIEFFH